MTTEQKQYAERSSRELEPYFSRHMLAMTVEDLRGKAEIADELAYRDKQIDTLAAKVKELEADVEHYKSASASHFNQAMRNGEAANLAKAKLSTVTGQLDDLLAALKRLACLGNGDKYGNSDGNIIAQEAIAKIEAEKA